MAMAAKGGGLQVRAYANRSYNVHQKRTWDKASQANHSRVYDTAGYATQEFLLQ